MPYGTLRWCHMAHSIGAIWHTRSVQIYYKNMQFSTIFRHSDGAIWHTGSVPCGTFHWCHMATGTLGVCYHGGTRWPPVAGGPGGEFFVSGLHYRRLEFEHLPSEVLLVLGQSQNYLVCVLGSCWVAALRPHLDDGSFSPSISTIPRDPLEYLYN